MGDRVIVHFENRLSQETTIHWHGLRIDDEMDGTPRVQEPIGPRDTFTYDFVVPDAGSYWYHPHVRGNEQVERGLYGLFIVRGEDEPSYHRERYFTLDDILLTDDGSPPFLQSRPEMMHGRTGNVLLTNGTAKVHELEARKAAPDEPLFTFEKGKTVRITLDNQAGPEHPFHLHRQFFTVVDDGRPVTDKPGLKDTVLVPGRTKLEIIAYMDNPGRWMTHCHILEHVELGMMAEMVVEE